MELRYIDNKGESVFNKIKNNVTNYLEIGLYKGESLSSWKDYFNCNIYGIDITLKNITVVTSHYTIFEANAIDPTAIPTSFNSIVFDVIVDDSSHLAHLEVFNNYSKFLAINGIYIIETYKSKFCFYRDMMHLKSTYRNFDIKTACSSISKLPVLVCTRLT